MSKNANGGNGHDPDEKKVVNLPTLAERDRMKREEREEEKRWRAQYRKESRASREPFLNIGNIPPFTRALIAAFIIIHLPLYLGFGESTRVWVFYTFGFIPGAYTSTFEWQWTAFISPLTHALIHGSWMHLLFNLVMGLALSMFFEKIFRARATAIFFMLCTLGGAGLYMAFSPFSTVPVIGASGGISGLFGAVIYVMMTQQSANPLKQRLGKYGPWPVLGFWAALMVIPALLMGENIAWQAHLGGYLTGLALIIGMQKGIIRF